MSPYCLAIAIACPWIGGLSGLSLLQLRATISISSLHCMP